MRAGTFNRSISPRSAPPSPLPSPNAQMRITPTYRGPGKADTFPHYANAPRLLLATHSRLMWYRYDTDELRVLHEGQVRAREREGELRALRVLGPQPTPALRPHRNANTPSIHFFLTPTQGVYYGVFPGAERDVLTSPISLWAICRPLHWRADGAAERLLNIHLESGKELGSVQVGGGCRESVLGAVHASSVPLPCSRGSVTLPVPAPSHRALQLDPPCLPAPPLPPLPRSCRSAAALRTTRCGGATACTWPAPGMARSSSCPTPR